MKYFLFKNHPKADEIYHMNEEAAEAAHNYFQSVDILETEIKLEGREYKAIIDYTALNNYTNFDCFNCVNDCCADSPSKLTKKKSEFLLENLDEFNKLTSNFDIAREFGYEDEALANELAYEESREIIESIEEDSEMCFYGYKNDSGITMCAVHSICLAKGLGYKGVCENKHLVCLLWPLEIFCDDEETTLYITLPDEFTNGFTIEDYYKHPCINERYAGTKIFRKKNPKGFLEKDYKPFIENYKETLINIFGKEFYKEIKKKIDETYGV